MDNYRSSGVNYQNQGTNTNNNGGKNRNRKKKNKQNQNQNVPLSPSKNMINHYSEYGGSMSLDHQSFGRPYNNKYPNNQNYNYNNHNNRGKYNNGNFNKRRNGSQSNYYSSGTYDNDRLNKSLTPNSSFGENSKIQTSISLDNFDLVSSLNAKRSPTSSYPLMSSNVVINQKPTSPFKNGTYQQQQTIIEQVNLEEMSETTNSLSLHEVETKSNDVLSSITSTESLNTSGDFMVDHHTPLSNYSTPMNHSDSSRVFDPDMSPKKHREHEESLNQNDKTPVKYDESEHTVKHDEAKSDNSSAISSNSSPDSKNSDQNLVTASEGEVSFTNENVTVNHHEHNLAKELEKIAANFELDVHKNQETESNKSVDGSNESSATESFTTTSNERDDEHRENESTESNVEMGHSDNPESTDNNQTELVIQEIKLEQVLNEDKKEDTVIEDGKEEVQLERVEIEVEHKQQVEEHNSDVVTDVSVEEKKELTVVEVDERLVEPREEVLDQVSLDTKPNETKEEAMVEADERLVEPREEVLDQVALDTKPNETKEEVSVEVEERLVEPREEVLDQVALDTKPNETKEEAMVDEEIMLDDNKHIEEKIDEIKEVTVIEVDERVSELREKIVETEKMIEENKMTIEAEIKEEKNSHNLIGTPYEINIRPHVEEINLIDGEIKKQETDLNIAPVETENHEQTCDEDHQEFEILEQANESIVSELNDKTNTSITQKEPAVDCFSCTIV